MSLHKLYVALSELKYLTKLKYSDKLLAWFPNDNADGKWKADVRIFFAEMWMPR